MTEGTKPEREQTRKFRAIKGTRDILPPDSALWNWFEATARGVMESYNFAEIRTPIFEETELFARSIGVETDVVNKEMYSFWGLASWRANILRLEPNVEDISSLTNYINELWGFLDEIDARSDEVRSTWTCVYQLRDLLEYVKLDQRIDGPGGDPSVLSQRTAKLNENVRNIRYGLALIESSDLTLRPEATASVCRAYIEHGMHTLPGDVKLYYIGPMFRRERPQKGRYRQFYQIGAEVLGASDAPAIDAELIEMLTVLLTRCQIEKWTLLVNSIGCPDTPEKKGCRPAYVALLREELRKPEIFSKLGPDSQRRVETNPLRVMDSKLPEEQPIIEKLPKISEHLCAECAARYEQLKKELDLRKIPYQPAPRLVRGLDYYMRTTFEITSPVLGAQNALCGGGRYDGLVEMLGGPKDIKGIGFALGEDRFIDAIVEAKKIAATRAVDVFIAWMGENAYPLAVRLARTLRDANCAVELPPTEMKFRKALERADKLKARYALILGEDEVRSGELTLKRLADGEQKKIPEAALLANVSR